MGWKESRHLDEAHPDVVHTTSAARQEYREHDSPEDSGIEKRRIFCISIDLTTIDYFRNAVSHAALLR